MVKLPKLSAAVPSGAAAAKLNRFFRPQSNENHERRDATILGVALTFYLLSTAAIYLSLTGCLAMIVLLGACRYLCGRFPRFIPVNATAASVVAISVSLYISLIQPTIGLALGPCLLGVLFVFFYRRVFAGKTVTNRFLLWVHGLGHVATMCVGFALCLFGYKWLYTLVVPAVHPFTVAFYNVSPCVYVVGAAGLTLYCLRRMQASKSLVYKLLPFLSAVLFVACYPMHDAAGAGYFFELSTGDFVAIGFAFAVLTLSFVSPRLLRLVATGSAAAFVIAFTVVQVSPWAYMSAVGLSMPVKYAQRPEPTVFNRIMPLPVGQALCPQGDTTPFTKVGNVSVVIIGNRFDYQCAEHYSSWVGTDPLFSLIDGSTASIIRVDAGTKSGDVKEISARFPWGEDSAYERAALMVRHPGATIGDFNYTTTANGAHEVLAVSFTQRRLAWTAMVPAQGGTVVESPSGGFQDFTVAESATAFPDFFQVPEAVISLRARAWAAYRNPFASAWSPDEVSDTDGTVGNNHPPFALQLKSGPAYFIGLEPQGTNGTAMSYLMFFDARFGTATVIDVSHSSPKLKGLKDIQHTGPSVVAGNNGLYGMEPMPIIMDDGRAFYAVSLMGPRREMRNLDFQGVAVFTMYGDKAAEGVLDGSDQVISAIKDVPSIQIGHTPPAAKTP